MEKQIITREPREWDAQAYDAGNTLQTSGFLHFLKTNNINTKNKTILSAGCGTGKVENILAKKATHIHGFDASKNMIDSAQKKYGHIKNLSFEHCFAEDFQTQNLKQLALASFCIHWFEDKKQAFQRINDSLEINGEFFGTVSTSDNPKPLNLIVFLEMLPTIDWLYKLAYGKELKDLIGASYPSHEELNTMLKETNFEIIKSEEQIFNYTIENRDALKDLHWPIIASRPIVKYIPNVFIQPFFENFIDRLMAKLQKNENGSFNEILYTTIVHARKVKK